MKKIFFKLKTIKFILISLGLLIISPSIAWGDVSLNNVKVGLVTNTSSQAFSLEGNYVLLNQTTGAEVAKINSGQAWQAVFTDGKIKLLQNGAEYKICDFSLVFQDVGSKNNVTAQSTSGDLALLSANSQIFLKNDLNDLVVCSVDGSKALGESFHVLSANGQTALANKTSPPSTSTNTNLDNTENSYAYSSSGEGVIVLNNKKYRGNLILKLSPSGMAVINELPLEQYLYGVVPSEMPSSWGVEALKAQAVVARTYAVAKIEGGAYSGYGFDILATQQSQVYGGINSEVQRVRDIVDSTKGEIITYRGNAVDAVFHSSSGGYTENSEDIWVNSLDYLKTVKDSYDYNEDHYNWQVSYTQDELVRLISGFKCIIDLKIKEFTDSGARIKKLVVVGLDNQDKQIEKEISNADNVRMVFSLKSALFSMDIEKDENGLITKVLFKGSGYGHGLGMSQYGALGMAEAGYTYKEILDYYYNNTTLQIYG